MSETAAAPLIYLALAPCGCVKAAMVDPEHDERAAAELAWARERYMIKVVENVDWSSKQLRLECPKCTEGGIYGPR